MKKKCVDKEIFSKELILLAELVKKADATLYAVGGFVRNSLMGLKTYDIDICSKLSPERVIELCKKEGFRVVPKGIDFGMVEIHIGSESFEHTTFRSDIYEEGGGHRPREVKYSNTIVEDAFRRDFTVNALYADILSGELIDPTGGMDNIINRQIRTTSLEPKEVLSDDGLRIMRLVRFAAELNFEIEEKTFETAKLLVSNLRDISSERIRDELNKILLSDIKYGERNKETVFHGLKLLDEIGALDIIFPELSLGRHMEQKATHHRYDVLNHCLHTTSETTPKLTSRLAGLLHDVGKPVVKLETGKMYGHDRAGERISREILHRLHYDNATIDEVCFIVKNHMYDLNNTAKESTLRMRFARWGYERSLEIAAIREADVHGSGVITGEVKSAERWRKLLKTMRDENVPFSESELNCSGKEIMEWLNIPAGPLVGEIKRRLFMHCARFPKDNNPEKLRRIARDMY